MGIGQVQFGSNVHFGKKPHFGSMGALGAATQAAKGGIAIEELVNGGHDFTHGHKLRGGARILAGAVLGKSAVSHTIDSFKKK